MDDFLDFFSEMFLGQRHRDAVEQWLSKAEFGKRYHAEIYESETISIGDEPALAIDLIIEPTFQKSLLAALKVAASNYHHVILHYMPEDQRDVLVTALFIKGCPTQFMVFSKVTMSDPLIGVDYDTSDTKSLDLNSDSLYLFKEVLQEVMGK